MDQEAVFDAIAEALDKVAKESFGGAAGVAEFRKQVTELVALLVARGALNEGHKRLLERVARATDERPKVRLKVWPDKYQTPNSDIDCMALMPICGARCCSLRFALSKQDVEEGKIKFDLDDPYMIRHDDDGLCTHFARDKGGGCGIYEHRPAPCRMYDCRQDKRIWQDFDAKIPQPLPVWLALPKSDMR